MGYFISKDIVHVQMKKRLEQFSFFHLLPGYFAKAATNKLNAKSIRARYILGGFMYFLGLYIQTKAEYDRMIFKHNPMNKGKLYSEGWNSYTRNPNYFGELLLFTGWNLFT